MVYPPHVPWYFLAVFPPENDLVTLAVQVEIPFIYYTLTIQKLIVIYQLDTNALTTLL